MCRVVNQDEVMGEVMGESEMEELVQRAQVIVYCVYVGVNPSSICYKVQFDYIHHLK